MATLASPSPGLRRNPNYRITIRRFSGTVIVTFAGAIVASTTAAKVLREEHHPPVYYIPFRDIYFEFLTRSGRKNHNPYLGDSSHWNITASGEADDDVMCAYETPYEEFKAIRNHGAFDPNKVRVDILPSAKTWHP
jgi:uncharacterized protein (DUF427 family)